MAALQPHPHEQCVSCLAETRCAHIRSHLCDPSGGSSETCGVQTICLPCAERIIKVTSEALGQPAQFMCPTCCRSLGAGAFEDGREPDTPLLKVRCADEEMARANTRQRWQDAKQRLEDRKDAEADRRRCIDEVAEHGPLGGIESRGRQYCSNAHRDGFIYAEGKPRGWPFKSWECNYCGLDLRLGCNGSPWTSAKASVRATPCSDRPQQQQELSPLKLQRLDVTEQARQRWGEATRSDSAQPGLAMKEVNLKRELQTFIDNKTPLASIGVRINEDDVARVQEALSDKVKLTDVLKQLLGSVLSSGADPGHHWYEDRAAEFKGRLSWASSQGSYVLGSADKSDLLSEAPVDRTPANDRREELLPDGWESKWNDQHNRFYYFCRATGERQWTKPLNPQGQTAQREIQVSSQHGLSRPAYPSPRAAAIAPQGVSRGPSPATQASAARLKLAATPLSWAAASPATDGSMGSMAPSLSAPSEAMPMKPPESPAPASPLHLTASPARGSLTPLRVNMLNADDYGALDDEQSTGAPQSKTPTASSRALQAASPLRTAQDKTPPVSPLMALLQRSQHASSPAKAAPVASSPLTRDERDELEDLLKDDDLADPKPRDEQSLAEGQSVVVKCDCHADGPGHLALKAGLKGRVQRIDEKGDALIEFESMEYRQWIFKVNLSNLQADAEAKQPIAAEAVEAPLLMTPAASVQEAAVPEAAVLEEAMPEATVVEAAVPEEAMSKTAVARAGLPSLLELARQRAPGQNNLLVKRAPQNATDRESDFGTLIADLLPSTAGGHPDFFPRASPRLLRRRHGSRGGPKAPKVTAPDRPLQGLLGRPRRPSLHSPAVAFTSRVTPTEILKALALPLGWAPKRPQDFPAPADGDKVELKVYEGPRSKRARLGAGLGAVGA